MFECLIGWPPFCAEEPHDTYRKIVDWQRYLSFPPDQQLSQESEGFIRGQEPPSQSPFKDLILTLLTV